MNRKRLLSAVALLACYPVSAFAEPTELWSVTCMQGGSPKTWGKATAPNITNGAFQFTLEDGTEVRTTAGMNCYATRYYKAS
jgi:hypothetical protein